jgi:hypothetical protein
VTPGLLVQDDVGWLFPWLWCDRRWRRIRQWRRGPGGGGRPSVQARAQVAFLKICDDIFGCWSYAMERARALSYPTHFPHYSFSLRMMETLTARPRWAPTTSQTAHSGPCSLTEGSTTVFKNPGRCVSPTIKFAILVDGFHRTIINVILTNMWRM